MNILKRNNSYLKTMEQAQKVLNKRNTAIFGIAGTGKTNIIKTNIMHHNQNRDNLFLALVGYMPQNNNGIKQLNIEEVNNINANDKIIVTWPQIEKNEEKYYTYLKSMWDMIKNNPCMSSRLYIEEADLFMQSEEPASLLAEIMTTSQKYNCTAMITSRYFNAFTTQDAGLKILKETPNIIMFTQIQKGAETAQNLYKLSNEEKEILSIQKTKKINNTRKE